MAELIWDDAASEHRLEEAPRGTADFLGEGGGQAGRVGRASWERCSCPAITSETGVLTAKWWARTALPAGSARESGAETPVGQL